MERLLNSNSILAFDGESNGKGRHFTSKFIEPGLVSYDSEGVLKVTKQALDKFCQTIVGCPVIVKHSKVTDENADDLRVGVVNSCYFDIESGWYVCDGIIWDKEAIDLIGQGWAVSCCYKVTDSTGEAGESHNMSYDDELLDGVFEHLAIVPNPRYEEATIILNSKGEDKIEMFKNLFNSKKIRNSEKEEEMEKLNSKDTLKKVIELLNSLANSEDEEKEEKENASEEEEKEEKENSECEEKKENSEDSEDKEEKENSEDSDEEDKKENAEDEEKEEERKENSKSKLSKLHNSNSGISERSGYESEQARLARGLELF